MKKPFWATGVMAGIEKPEDFIVTEAIDPKFTRKFTAGKKVDLVKGRNTLFIMKKKSMTTKDAVGIVCRRFATDEIGFAGLKDKFAVTSQYLTVRGNLEGFEDKIKLEKICTTDRKLSKGDLIGNKFEITLENFDYNFDEKRFIRKLREGVPNYFGPQRLGRDNKNAITGMNIIKGKVPNLGKEMIKFYMNSYQSLIFNETLDAYVKKYKKPVFSKIKIFGYDTMLGKNKTDILLKKIIEMHKISGKDFMLRGMKICCRGSEREAFIKVDGVKITRTENMKLEFFLPRGSYATVLLKEMENFIRPR